MAYQLFTDTGADFSRSMTGGYPPVHTVPLGITIDGHPVQYGENGDLTTSRFYAMQRAGKFATTSQPSPDAFRSAFLPYLQNGADILYLGLSSGISGTVNSARICMDALQMEYPERTLVCIDTLCASVGLGLLVCEAARKQAEGFSLEALADWVMAHRLDLCHWFTVDTFEHLKHGGRVSSASAAVGTMLKIKPMLRIDEAGALKVVEKPRGSKRAKSAQLAHMEQGWSPEIGTLVVIGHGDCPDEAQELKDLVAARFPDADIYIADIGPVIGAHTGPGMLALVCWGNNR